MNRRELLTGAALLGGAAQANALGIGRLGLGEGRLGGFGKVKAASQTVTPVTFDVIAPAVGAASANTISLSMTVGVSANAMHMAAHFGYSQHTGFGLTWTVGSTVQIMGVTPNFGFILTSDNGAAAPAIAEFGLLNPTPGAGTLTMAFTGLPDNLVLQATTFKNVNLLGGLSGAFAAAKFGTGTSAAATISMPAILGGIAMGFSGGVAGAPTTWNSGTQLYSATGGTSWGSGVYQAIGVAGVFSLGINASEFWAASGVVVNPASVFPSGTLAINSGNSIASGLTAAMPALGNTTLTDLVSGKTAVPVGCTTDLSGGYGGGLAVPSGSTTAKADFGVFQPFPNGDYSCVVIWNPTASGQGSAFGQADSAVANFIDMEKNSTFAAAGLSGAMAMSAFNGTSTLGSDDGARAVSAGTYHVGMIDGNYHAFGGRKASGVPSSWCDGANTTVNTGAVTGTITNASQHFAIGNLGNYTGSAFSAGCTVVLVLVWNRALSDAEMASITANPFQVLV